MFSVNIDKIVSMTDNERKCYDELVQTLKSELGTSKCLAVTKDGHLLVPNSDLRV